MLIFVVMNIFFMIFYRIEKFISPTIQYYLLKKDEFMGLNFCPFKKNSESAYYKRTHYFFIIQYYLLDLSDNCFCKRVF